MILNCICSRIKTILLGFLNIFKRALCIVNRRKPSVTDFEPLNTVSVVHSSTYTKPSGTERDWNTWDDAPRTVEEHIEQYRERLAKPAPVNEPQQEINYFEDMTPQIREQQKVYIPSTNDDTNQSAQERNFSRLQATGGVTSIPVTITNELKDWEELEQQQGWEEVDDESTKKLIRETRKELRNQKQQQQRQHFRQ